METMNQRVQVRENGKVKTITLRDAYVKKLTEKALNGNMREMLAFLKEIERVAPELLQNETEPEDVVVRLIRPDGEATMIENYLKRNPGAEI